jgi:predicted ribosome quality control (RQC) complex YloA/Tae2 family protein
MVIVLSVSEFCDNPFFVVTRFILLLNFFDKLSIIKPDPGEAMQPFDALTMQAVIQEAKPLLINRRVDDVHQIGRDDLVIGFRNKAGQIQLLLSAHASYGRICLIKTVTSSKGNERIDRSNDARSGFVSILRRQLHGATLVGVEQLNSERVVDFVFSCVDEVGTASIKVLTAEIMGRHSNLIFWQQSEKNILAASHLVTKDMSRHREVLLGAKYARPPAQDKPNVFTLIESDFNQAFNSFMTTQNLSDPPTTLAMESFLLSTYSGLGRHLAHELITAAIASLPEEGERDALIAALWQQVSTLKSKNVFSPAIKKDFSRYTILSLSGEQKDSEEWKPLLAVNDLVDEYYKTVSAAEAFRLTKERLLNDAKAEVTKLQTRLDGARSLMDSGSEIDKFKLYGDLVLANMQAVAAGQSELKCTNYNAEPAQEVAIPLSVNLSAVQNAQSFYRQYAKARNRARTAHLAVDETNERLKAAQAHLELVEKADTNEHLQALKKSTFETKQPVQQARPPREPDKRQKPKMKLLTVTSADGWIIYIGRNRHENDHLLSRIAQPNDVWLHVLGQSGAHVLVKVPNSKQEPPLTTLKEAAGVAARFSKVPPNTKARIVYTQVRHVRKVANGKPGVVRYENEKTLEVDTGAIGASVMKQLSATQTSR